MEIQFSYSKLVWFWLDSGIYFLPNYVTVFYRWIKSWMFSKRAIKENISAFSMDKNEVGPHLQFDIFLPFVFFKATNIFTQHD